MDRRVFVVSLGSGLAALGPRGASAADAVQVTATPTLFHGHPDGATTLVRFEALGLDAPAGRLRVHDLRTGRQLGTAGMIRRGDRLTGELWLPLATPIRVRSELEAPGRRAPLRTVHPLMPTPRWRVFWLTLASPDTVRETIARLPVLLRGVEASRFLAAGVRVNPWRRLAGSADHLDLVRLTVPAAAASRVTGVPLGRLGLIDGPADPHVTRALRAAGVEVLVHRNEIVDPAALDLAGGRAPAAPLIEAWLRTLDGGHAASPIAVAIGTEPAFAVRATAGVEEWNGAYAFPRIAVGDGDEVIAGVTGLATGATGATGTPGTTGATEATGVTGATGADPFAVLAGLVSPLDPTRRGVAERFAFLVGGTLVFNPSPFGRSDIVTPEGGSPRLVTDVPGLGYAFVPDAAPAAVSTIGETERIETAMFRVAVERAGGAIAELTHRATGRSLVRAGGGLNGLPDGVFSAVRAERIDGIGERLVVRRVTATRVLQSTITASDVLPWLDIENVTIELAPADGTEPGADAEWTWDFGQGVGRATWEVPGGTDSSALPVQAARMIRWVALHGDAVTLLFGSARPAALAVDDTGTMRIRSTPASRFRIALLEDNPLPDDPWRFGFGMLPLSAVPTPGLGDRRLPTFGRLLDVADPAVATLAIRPADDGVGIMVYLQELGGPSRDIIIRPEVLAFDGALLTDLAERDQREAATAPGGGILVPIEASGWAAVRLLGVRLAT